jgi:hypothetical protein
VVRDGTPVDWSDHYAVYDPVDGDGPVSQEWYGGTLTVTAGGRRFVQTVSAEGEVTAEPVSRRHRRQPAKRCAMRLAGRALLVVGTPGAEATVTVVRLDGSTVVRHRFRGDTRVPLHRLASGTYLVRVKDAHGRRTDRIVVGP